MLQKLWQIPWSFVLLLCAVAAVGYVALYSAGGGAEPYAAKHALRFGFGVVMMVSIGLVDIRVIARFAWVGYAGGIVLLVLVLLHGNVGKGAQRWIDIGPLQLQPSELMKIMLVLGLAAWFQRATWERMGNLLFLIPPALMVLLPVGLILKQPNLGTALITGMVGAGVFFAAGVRWWKFAIIAGGVAVAAPIAYDHLHDYQRARITTFLDPESDPLGAGYNIIQSKIALGSGGLWGKGFLQGTQGHLNFLPEKQTDFIFTMIAEEFGLVGALSVLGAAGAGGGLLLRRGAALPAPIRPAAGGGVGDEFLPLCLRQCGDGHRLHPRRRRAPAADLAWRFGHADDDAGLRAAAIGLRASGCGIRTGARLGTQVLGRLGLDKAVVGVKKRLPSVA